MTPERWKQIEEIFHGALELDGVERVKFLSTRTEGDTDLRAEVEKLLSQFDEASSFIEQPLYDSARSGVLRELLDDLDDDPMVGKVLGSYRIEREIGRGGMGAVYEAVRADGEFRLRVALKVVKRGVDTDFVLRRFRNERQILAALDHPYITRLIDGGTTEDGRPYFVMEYIDGLPLYRYCDRQRLSIEERLKLFTRVCEAVEYAHQKQIIHRDIKPSNIFITNDGTPRLLDFGIAKLLDPELAIDTLRPTATALRMMTVDYASPEQIRGEAVTYATDIYSLGVVLFELLTGFRPYALESRSPHDVARAICDDEPQLPSEAINGSGSNPVPVNATAATLTNIAGLRRESPTELRSRITGDLDSIVCTALQKKPADRYESVEALRTDIQRHLDGQDISAHKTYTPPLKKSVDNISTETKLVAVLPLSLMGPSGEGNTDEAYLTVGLADAIITRLASVRKLTVRPTSSITRYNEHQVNPFRAGRELGVDFVLDGRIRRFGDRLRISLQLLDVNNGSAIWAGQFDEHFTDVLELEDAISEHVAEALIPQLTGEDKEKLAKRGTNDPRAYEAYLRGRFYWNQFTAQSFPKAIEAFNKAIAIDPEYALAHVGVADFFVWANIYGLLPVAEAYEKAESAARRALQIDPELGEAYASMGLITHNRFEYGRSERLLRKAIELSPHYSLAHEWLSAVLIGTGRFDEGVAEMRVAEELDPLSLRTKILSAWSFYQAGEISAALSKVEEVIDLDEHYPQGHLQRGYILCEFGRGEEAVAELELGNRLMPGSPLGQYYLCFGYAAAGRKSDALKLADAMEEQSRREYVKPMFLALANVAVGRIDRAFVYLNAAVEECDPWLIWFGTERKLKVLQGDPRYTELLHQTNKTFVGGSLQTLSSERNVHTSLFDSGPDTSPESVPQTRGVRGGFLKRHSWKLAAAGFAVVALIAAYAAGIVVVNYNGSPMVLRQIPTPVRSIAVLPFENATGDTANDYVSDGMTDSLISRISSSTNTRTVPRAAAFAFRNRDVDPQTAGKELGVDSVLTGSLTKQGPDYVLKLEMIGVADGKSLLSTSIVEKPDRIFALQDAMFTKVVDSLGIQSGNAAISQKSYTENNEAFQLYLRGEYNRQKGTPAGMSESIDQYLKAIEIDPNYALAYQGLALAYRSSPAYGYMSPQDAIPKAKEAAQKALSLDPSLSTAYASLASIKATYDWDFAGAEAEYKRAIQMSPNNAETHYSYGNFLVAMGRTDEALVELRNALQIDPLSLNTQTNIGWALYIAGRYDEAAAQIRQVIDRDPTFARAYLNLGEILQEQGKNDEAIAAIQKARDLSKDPLIEMGLGHAYATAGRRAEAIKLAAELEEKVRQKQASPFLPAVVYAGLNDKDKAFYWFERAYQERSNWLTLIKVGRRLKNLHGDPRFDDLLRRIGFPA
jgi:serine/threonine protein kinase/tetratricopeptide (TPR) repeat protein